MFTQLHALALYGLGYGSAGLAVGMTGEEHVLGLLGQRQGPLTVFDVGAHTGAYAAMVYEQLGQRARIHCFEPDDSTFAELEARVSSIPSIVPHHVGLGEESGDVSLFSDAPNSPMASVSPESLAVVGREIANISLVRLTTVREVCEEERIDRLDLLKIDVEGTELAVLRGARTLLDSGRVGIVQFEFGYGNVASRTFLRDFYDLLENSHDLYRIAPKGLIRMPTYDLRYEVFVSATNYAAIPKSWNAPSGVCSAPVISSEPPDVGPCG